jgi:hypothetical protein
MLYWLSCTPEPTSTTPLHDPAMVIVMVNPLVLRLCAAAYTGRSMPNRPHELFGLAHRPEAMHQMPVQVNNRGDTGQHDPQPPEQPQHGMLTGMGGL